MYISVATLSSQYHYRPLGSVSFPYHKVRPWSLSRLRSTLHWFSVSNKQVQIPLQSPHFSLSAHGKQIQTFSFSPFDTTILASSTRQDGLVRIWKLPTDVNPAPIVGAPAREVDAAAMYLAGHEKKVEVIEFHPTVGNILATCSACVFYLIRLMSVAFFGHRFFLFAAIPRSDSGKLKRCRIGYLFKYLMNQPRIASHLTILEISLR